MKLYLKGKACKSFQYEKKLIALFKKDIFKQCAKKMKGCFVSCVL